MEGKRIKFKLKDMGLWNKNWWENRFGTDWSDKVYVGVLKDNLVTFTYKYQGIDETQPEDKPKETKPTKDKPKIPVKKESKEKLAKSEPTTKSKAE